MSRKYSHKILDYAKTFVTDVNKTFSSKSIWKTAKGTGDLNGNKVTDKVTKASKISPPSNFETIISNPKQNIMKYQKKLYIPSRKTTIW